MKIKFASQSYKSGSRPISRQRCVNMHAERQSQDAKTDVAVFGCPGIVDFATFGTGPVRGGRSMGGIPYVVSGGSLYSVTENGVATSLGGTISGTDPVSMSDNGTQLAIVNGTNGYVYSVTGGFQLIADTDFHAANTVAYSDGFFVFDRAGTDQFFLSDSLEGLSYDGLLFASAEWESDNLVAVVNHLEKLHLFGDRTTELHYNSGAANFPYQRIKGAGINLGVIGPHAITSDKDKIYFIGNDRVAYTFAGGASQLSTPAIEQEWQGYPVINDAFGMSYMFEGHRFIVYTFPTQNVTFGLDVTTGLWHERESHDEFGNSLGRWRGNCVFEAYGKTFVGDRFSGKIGYLDRTVFTEFGNMIRAELISPPIHGDGKRVFMPSFELNVETGVGLATGQGSDPQIMLSISDDGGRTFESPEYWQTMGAMGANKTQLRWLQLGSFYERCLKVVISDPVRRTIISAYCEGLRTG